MLRKSVAALAALVAVMALPLAADAQRARNHSIDGSKGRFAPINSVNNVTIYAGVVNGPIGKTVGELRVTPVEGENRVNATGTLYHARGTIKASWTNTVEPQADGSIKFVGTGRFTGGTRRFRGATGTFTFEATTPAGQNVVIVDFEGTIRY